MNWMILPRYSNHDLKILLILKAFQAPWVIESGQIWLVLLGRVYKRLRPFILRSMSMSQKVGKLAFLVADTYLYKRLCPSVRWSVGRSVGPWTRVEKWGNERFRCFLCMWVGDLWCGLGLDAPAHPSATILWPRVTCSSFLPALVPRLFPFPLLPFFPSFCLSFFLSFILSFFFVSFFLSAFHSPSLLLPFCSLFSPCLSVFFAFFRLPLGVFSLSCYFS